MVLKPRTRFWIEDEKGKIVFGTGRVRILRAIDRTGSMNKAAKELGMSYRTLWGKIHDTQARLGFRLIETSVRGARGGSQLTAESRELLKRFERWHDRMVKSADKLFAEVFKQKSGRKRAK